MQDKDFETTWMRLPFVMEMTASVKDEYSQHSQGAMANAKKMADEATWKCFTNELRSDQTVHRARVLAATLENAKRRTSLINALENQRQHSWAIVADLCDIVSPTWYVKPKDLDTCVPGKVMPWLDQAWQRSPLGALWSLCVGCHVS
jgi:hypothetical protein